MNDYPPDPTFQCPLIPVLMDLREHFYKAFLQHILRIFTVLGKTIAHTQHTRAKTGVQRLLGSGVVLQTSS
jgi:hypothetical protein